MSDKKIATIIIDKVLKVLNETREKGNPNRVKLREFILQKSLEFETNAKLMDKIETFKLKWISNNLNVQGLFSNYLLEIKKDIVRNDSSFLSVESIKNKIDTINIVDKLIDFIDHKKG